MPYCDGCKKAHDEIESLKENITAKYIEVKEAISEQKGDNNTQNAILEKLSDELITHMKEEGEHHLKVSEHMAKTNQILAQVPTKEDLAKTNGKISTIWIIGGSIAIVFLLSVTFLIWYIRTDINEHTTESSIINYNGTKKTIEKIVKKL